MDRAHQSPNLTQKTEPKVFSYSNIVTFPIFLSERADEILRELLPSPKDDED